MVFDVELGAVNKLTGEDIGIYFKTSARQDLTIYQIPELLEYMKHRECCQNIFYHLKTDTTLSPKFPLEGLVLSEYLEEIYKERVVGILHMHRTYRHLEDQCIGLNTSEGLGAADCDLCSYDSCRHMFADGITLLLLRSFHMSEHTWHCYGANRYVSREIQLSLLDYDTFVVFALDIKSGECFGRRRRREKDPDSLRDLAWCPPDNIPCGRALDIFKQCKQREFPALSNLSMVTLVKHLPLIILKQQLPTMLFSSVLALHHLSSRFKGTSFDHCVK